VSFITSYNATLASLWVGSKLVKAMHHKAKTRAPAPHTNILSLSPREFFRKRKIKPNVITHAFLKQHRVATIGELLEISISQESARVLKAIDPLRMALTACGLSTERYKFLMSYI